MRIDHVVANTSPLICLFKSGLDAIFSALFEKVVVPESVYREIAAKDKTHLAPRIKSIAHIQDIKILPSVAAWDLGDGESAVLSFAVENPGFWAIIDDREARRCAASLGCHYMGTVGAILLAKRKGAISSVRESLAKLQTAGLWLSEAFVQDVCRIANEE